MGIKKPGDKVLAQFLQRFLAYEVWMLRETYRSLSKPSENQVINNALIESFCVHVRNVSEFLKNKSSCNFDPKWFTVEKYRVDGDYLDRKLDRKLNTQISHLTIERTTDVKQKIDAKDRKRLLELTEMQLTRFYKGLLPEWKECCLYIANDVIEIDLGEPSATNEIVVVQSSTTSADIVVTTTDDGNRRRSD